MTDWRKTLVKKHRPTPEEIPRHIHIYALYAKYEYWRKK